MRGFVALVALRHVCRRRRRRLVTLNRAAQLGRVRLAHQLLERRLGEVGIAHVQRAVAKGAAHAFRQIVYVLWRIVTEAFQVVTFENVQHLDHRRPTGTRRRHGNDLVAPIGARHGCPFRRLIGRQVGFVDQSAVRRHFVGDQLGRGAFVESVAPLITHAGEGLGEIAQHELLAFCVGLAVLVVRRDRGGIRRKPRLCALERRRQSAGHREAVARQLYCRVDERRPRRLAVLLVRMREASHGTWHAHALVRVVVNARRVGAGAVGEHVRRGAGRRLLAEVDGGGLAAGETHHHESAAADIAGGGVGHRQRKAGGNGGVDCIATIGQHVATGLAGDGAGRNDHALRGVHGGARGAGGGRFLRAEGEGKDGASQPETGGHASGQGGEGHESAEGGGRLANRKRHASNGYSRIRPGFPQRYRRARKDRAGAILFEYAMYSILIS